MELWQWAVFWSAIAANFGFATLNLVQIVRRRRSIPIPQGKRPDLNFGTETLMAFMGESQTIFKEACDLTERSNRLAAEGLYLESLIELNRAMVVVHKVSKRTHGVVLQNMELRHAEQMAAYGVSVPPKEVETKS